jgi:hypothetical protein
MRTYIFELIGSGTHHLFASYLVEYEFYLPYDGLSLRKLDGFLILDSCLLLSSLLLGKISMHFLVSVVVEVELVLEICVLFEFIII